MGRASATASLGATVRFACDLDPVACAVHRANAPETTVQCRDVRYLTAAEVVAACGCVPALCDFSAPCVDFTHNGPRDPYGEDAALSWEVVRLVEEVRPTVGFISENVSALTDGVMGELCFKP